MKNNEILGALMIALGFIFGIYVGLVVMFIGGFIDIIHFAKSVWNETGGILYWSAVIGVIKMGFSVLVGWLSGLILIFPGWTLCNKK